MLTPPVIRAALTVEDETRARRIADLLTESFDNNEVAVATIKTHDGRWEVNAHFAQPPDDNFLRAQIGHAADDASAEALKLETVEARDWVHACLVGFVLVLVGRFVVFGALVRV